MIPITVVEFGSEEEALVLEVLRSGNVAQGPMVARLEADFADLIGVKHAIAVSNGTVSLVAALTALDLNRADEVLTSPLTFVATLNAILEAGATATFADISEDDFNLDPAAVAAAINSRTKVVMPVHLYGQIADMESIGAIADRHSLAIVEDAAQSHGAQLNARSAGTFGIGSFSLYATKNITTGEGGIITTNDDALAERLRIMRNQGMRARYEYVMAGHNYRMTDLQAALGVPQIARYGDVVAARQANAARLSELLRDIPGIILPEQLPGRRHVWHQYTVRVTGASGLTRDELGAKLHERQVGSGIYYPKLVFDYDPYRNRGDVIAGEYPVAEKVVKELLSLPVHNRLTPDELSAISDAVHEIAAGK